MLRPLVLSLSALLVLTVSYDLTSSEVSVELDGPAPAQLFPLEEGDDVGAQDDGSWVAVCRRPAPAPTGPDLLAVSAGQGLPLALLGGEC